MKRRAVFLLSALALLWERLCARLWVFAALVAVFAGLCLIGLPQHLSPAGHAALALCFAALALAALLHALASFILPKRAEVRHAIERESGLAHRPLTTLDDNAVGADTDTQKLWHQHQARAAGMLGQLRTYRPRTGIARQDRFRLRYIALLFLAVGFSVAQHDAPARLRQGFTPDITQLVKIAAPAFDLWITPPDYTHEAAIFLATAGQGPVAHDAAIAVPEGSTLHLRFSNAVAAPRLSAGGQTRTADEVAAGSYALDMPLDAGGDIELTSMFSTLGRWTVDARADTAPEIDLTAAEPAARATLKLTYTAKDDHGIARLTGIVTPPDGSAVKEAYRFDIPAADTQGHVTDLAAHPWAGQKVTVAIEAEDGAGHTATSKAVDITLPERVFTNPVAATLAEQRRQLMTMNGKKDFKPIIDTLVGIADHPGMYKGDYITFLSLDVAIHRIANNPSDDELVSVEDILWNLAVRLDSGSAAEQQAEARASLQELARALKDPNISDAQLREAIEAAQRKLVKYVRAFAADVQQRLRQKGKVVVLPPEIAKKFNRSVDINQMLQDMRRLSQGQSRDELQKLAESLSNTLDALDGQKLQQMQEKQAMGLEQLQKLDAIVKAEQSLFDRTARADAKTARTLAKEQTQLKNDLAAVRAKIAEAIGQAPETLDTAAQSMDQASGALGKGDSETARTHQKDALDALQKGLDSAAEQMASQMQQTVLSFSLSPGTENGDATDPLGRSLDDGMKLPDVQQRRRVQEIIEELRRRSNDPGRAPVERDYIERLLDKN